MGRRVRQYTRAWLAERTGSCGQVAHGRFPLVALAGLEPAPLGYEPSKLPLLYSAPLRLQACQGRPMMAAMNAAYEREGFFRTAWDAVATVGALVITLAAGAAFVVFWAAVIAGVTWLAVQAINALGEFLG